MINLTKFSNLATIVAVVLVALIWYAGDSTVLVPNLDEETKQFRYVSDSLVPKGSISNEIMFVQIILVGILLFSTQMKSSQGSKINEREFKEIVTRELIKKQNITLPDGKLELKRGEFRIDPNFITKKTSHNGKVVSSKYIGQVTLTDSKEKDSYYIVSINPMDGLLEDFVPVEEKLSLVDKCQDCGRFFDEKLILPEELKNLKDIKHLIQ